MKEAQNTIFVAITDSQVFKKIFQEQVHGVHQS